MSCIACTNTINGEAVPCSGTCGGLYHPTCIGLSKGSIMDLKCNPQLKWYCKGCAVIPYLQHLKSTLVGELRDLLRSDINNAISSLKQDFGRDVCPPRPVNDTHISDDGNYPPLAPTQINTGAGTNTNVTGPKQPQPPLLHGTGSSSNNDHAMKTVTVFEPRFWIYFAHISPDVTADNFTTFVKSRLNTMTLRLSDW